MSISYSRTHCAAHSATFLAVFPTSLVNQEIFQLYDLSHCLSVCHSFPLTPILSLSLSLSLLPYEFVLCIVWYVPQVEFCLSELPPQEADANLAAILGRQLFNCLAVRQMRPQMGWGRVG